ncbi:MULTISPECIES: hypothetical protein [unclassified Sphingobium]|uniref:hypothetical protein n=1 Tax=unclassified Sphingobium TaxID=2611147 RepID=UPI00222468F9|nr:MULTISPECIES: hypothetical protein [unclassified Sphingobium]MCW2413061.1 hypothetical protein [Sphingobium sp. B8D3D]MCW2414641.1 hypothetical protein [Sphingobium sp. B8D3A]
MKRITIMRARSLNLRGRRACAGLVAALLCTSVAPAATPATAAAPCERACLEGFVGRYLDAVAANQPSAVPISPNVRFTENGQRLLVGDGLWNTMKARGNYKLFVTDVAAGQVTFFGTIQEDHRDAAKFNGSFIALRLLVRDQQITEVEQIVFRHPTETDNASYNRLDGMAIHPKLVEAIPRAARLSRAELVTQANKYFTGLQKNDGKGDYPFTPDCLRHENGKQATLAPTPAGEQRPDPATATGYSGQWSCTEQFKSGLMAFVNRIRDRRFVAVDPERGLVFAFAFFDHSGGATRTFTTANGRTVTAGPVQPHTWQIAEIFKIEKSGLISKIDALLERAPYGLNSGWSTWEQGMSDHARDVTFEVPTGI